MRPIAAPENVYTDVAQKIWISKFLSIISENKHEYGIDLLHIKLNTVLHSMGFLFSANTFILMFREAVIPIWLILNGFTKKKSHTFQSLDAELAEMIAALG